MSSKAVIESTQPSEGRAEIGAQCDKVPLNRPCNPLGRAKAQIHPFYARTSHQRNRAHRLSAGRLHRSGNLRNHPFEA